jgi:MoaA/NifB/PqqE/SkfB family radical SAM enzyme
MFKHLDRIIEWQETGLSRPITYELDMTNVCNNRCSFCFGFYDGKDRSSLSVAEAKDIVRQVKDFGGKAVTFTGGGDPLCNPATIEAVGLARRIGLDVGFISNGLSLDERAAEVLVDSCTWIRISLDAGTPEVYRVTHGLNGATFNRVVANIKMLVRKKKERKSNATIGTGFITFPAVTADMVPFVRVSRDAGVDYAQFRPLLKEFSREEINHRPDTRTLKAVEKCLSLSQKGFNVLCSIHKYGNMKSNRIERGFKTCYGHHFAAVIAANKKMYLCCHMRGREKYCIGDLGKSSLKEIWCSRRRRDVYQRIHFKDCPLFCRCDGFNHILWDISQPILHENFL